MEEAVYSILYFCLLSCRLTDYRRVVLFIGSLISSIDLCVFCFSSGVRLVISDHDIFSFVLLSQDDFGYLGSFVVPYKFYDYFFLVP